MCLIMPLKITISVNNLFLFSEYVFAGYTLPHNLECILRPDTLFRVVLQDSYPPLNPLFSRKYPFKGIVSRD
jgi:hypothetical protein